MNVVVCMEGPVPGRAARHALELALQLGAPAAVSVLCAAANGAPPELRLPRKANLSRLVVIQEPRLARADHFVRAEILARAAASMQASLIMTGTASSAEGLGLVGAAIAHHLAWNYVARIESAALDSDFPTALLVDVRSGGRFCRLQIPLPAVLSVAPPPPTLGRRRAGTPVVLPPIESLDIAKLGLEPTAFQTPGLPEGDLDNFDGKIITAVSAQDLVDKLARTPEP